MVGSTIKNIELLHALWLICFFFDPAVFVLIVFLLFSSYLLVINKN